MTDPSVTVRLVGGPDDWHESTLDHLTAEELNGPREALGAYLISEHVPPGHPDAAARAVYEPDADPSMPADVWWFRGWFPTAPEQAEVTGRAAIDGVVTDRLGAPVYWHRDGDAEAIHETSRLLVRWEAEQDQPTVWRVRALAPDGSTGEWELCEADGEWTAGPLPHAPREHDDFDDLID